MRSFVTLVLSLALILPSISFAASETPLYTEEKTNIIVTADHPQFSIQLKSNPTTGFSWSLKEYNDRYVEPVKHSFKPPISQLVGAPGYEVWIFKVKKEAFRVSQQTSIRFVYARPWEKANSSAKAVVFSVSTMEP